MRRVYRAPARTASDAEPAIRIGARDPARFPGRLADDQRRVLREAVMRRIRDQHEMGEHLLLDPRAGAVQLEEQRVAGLPRIVDGDQARDAAALLGIDRPAAGGGEPAVGRDVHVPRLDRRAGPAGEVAQDQDARAIEVAGVADREPDLRAQPQQHDHRPARLAAREDDELGARVGVVDVVEERRLVLEQRDAARGERDELGAAELAERQRGRIAERRVTRDVVEDLPAAPVRERAERVDQDAGVVAQEPADLERERGGVAGARGLVAGDLRLRGRIEGEQRGAEAQRAVGTGGEGLAVAEHARGEVRDPDRLAELPQGVEGGGDVGDDRGGVVRPALGGDRPALPASGGRGGALVGEERAGGRARRGRKRGQRGDQGVADGGALGRGISRPPIEGGVEQRLELDAGGDARQVEPGAAGLGRDDGAGVEQLAQRGDGGRVGVDGDRAGEPPGALAPVEDRAERGTDSGSAVEHRADRIDLGAASHAGDDSARRLLSADAGERAAAFADGCAPSIGRALDGRIAAVLTADRAPWYLTVLYGLLLFRRDHELVPLHEDLWARVVGPSERLGSYDGPAFAQDLDQMIAWGAIERITEAYKLRSYRDNRRERFRYRLTDDAVALLEWLEARLAAKLAGRMGDSRDRLTDVVGHIRELRRLLDGRREAPDAARRALYLIEAIGDAIDEVGTELLTFRAEMIAFASRRYEIAALREILGWLERYVALYVRRLSELRGDIEGRLRELRMPRYRDALEGCRRTVLDDRAAQPRAFRGVVAIAAPAERLDAHAAFFAAGGRLAGLCARIDESARGVVVKMQRHLRELERRSERLGDLRAAIRAVAAGAERDPRYAELVRGVIAAAHVRVDRRAASSSGRLPPPLPRAHARTGPPAAPRPISRKRAGLEAVRELAARRRALLGSWLADLLGEEASLQLSARPPRGEDAPRRWLEVARARHLGGGRTLAEIGFAIAPRDGDVLIGDAEVGLIAPDCTIERRQR